MNNPAAKKGQGLEELLAKIEPQPVEEIVQREMPLTGISTLLEKYQALLKENINDAHEVAYTLHRKSSLHRELEQQVKEILTPTELAVFLQSTMLHEEDENYARATGLFLTVLIQNSYRAGGNNFILPFHNLPAPEDVGLFLRGDGENPIVITLQGTGQSVGNFSQNVVYKIEGNAKYRFGQKTNATYIITRNLISFSCHQEAAGVTFKVYKKKALQKLLKITRDQNPEIPPYPEVPEGNRIYFVKTTGEEVIMRDFDDPVLHDEIIY